MSKLVLANIDYRRHMTDEGEQLQLGLEAAGWTLVGVGYGGGCRDVPQLLERYRPEMVLVSDKRDWDPVNSGSFRKDIGFTNLSELSKHPEVFKMCVVKDAGGMHDYHRRFCEEISADAIVTYYHDLSVLPLNRWMLDYPTIRTYHTIDATLNLHLPHDRKRAVVSGAIGDVYPLRRTVALNRQQLGVDLMGHPGYSNKGCVTPGYLKALAGYRVHVATASKFGFALRKIIESVAVCATPVTNLPVHDCLPGIDKALVRINDNASLREIRDAIDYADRGWDIHERATFAAIAKDLYDYRAMGVRLSAAIEALKVAA